MARFTRTNSRSRVVSSTTTSHTKYVLLLMFVSFVGIYNTNPHYKEYMHLYQHNKYDEHEGQEPTTESDDFALARRESLGFFDDISSAHWNLLKQKVSEMSPNYSTWYLPYNASRTEPAYQRIKKMGQFYQSSYEPDFVCQHERRIGKRGDGGKWICDPHRITKQQQGDKSCLVYSIGSNNDFSFEKSVQQDIGAHCEIHTFDFGNYAAGAAKAGVHYHRVGLGGDHPPKFNSLSTVVKDLGHEGRTIDIFKIDCEGCEWKTAHEWFTANVTLRQIQVELHKSDVIVTPTFFDLLYQHNYVITHKEPNIAYPGAIEYAFLKLAPSFSTNIVRAKGAPAAV